MITTWYLQSQRTWDKLCHSCIGSSFLPRGAFPEGRAYAFPQRLHAGSLEALRVSRPEAVVLAVNNFYDFGRFSVPWRNGVVPLAVEIMGTQSDSLHLLLRDLDLGRVAPCIQTGLDLQARRRRRRGDQLDDDLVAHQRPTTPVHCD